MLKLCFEPASVLACLDCLQDGNSCKKLYEIRDALWLKSMDECLDCDSNCRKCHSCNVCMELQEVLFKKIPRR